MQLRKLNLPAKWRQDRSDQSLFDAMMNLEGTAFREFASRKTQRTLIEGESVFIKKHFGVGWFEIFKNLLMFRRPIVDAGREWDVLRVLYSAGIKAPRALALGISGFNPARRESFVILEDLDNMVSLETLALDKPPALKSVKIRRRLIQALADVVRRLHVAGINHRDLYLCHFLLPEGRLENMNALHLIDFHRAQVRERIPRRWVVKDLASLSFSAWPLKLSMRDKLYFIRCYTAKPLKLSLKEDPSFWRAIDRKAIKLYNEYMSKYATCNEKTKL